MPFQSRNVLADAGALQELLAFGPKQLPVVARGQDWVNGQSLKEVAKLLGIELGAVSQLPPAELVRRIDIILAATQRFYRQFPERNLADLLKGRPRSYSQLVWHLFNVADAFLEHERGIALTIEAYSRNPPDGTTRDAILAYGGDVRTRFAAWWQGAADRTDWQAPAKVYYGGVSRHEYLERTTWHVGQHARQLMSLLADTLGLAPNQPLPAELWRGLPIPEQVWD